MSKEVESKIEKKCSECKKEKILFYFHECRRSVQEYYGCKVCDNWCTSCKPSWNDNDKEK